MFDKNDSMTDTEWLKQNAPVGFEINEDILYDFSERVSIAVIDGGCELERARRYFFEQIAKAMGMNL